MSTEEAIADAEKHYDMPEWKLGCEDSYKKDHVNGTPSYNAGYSFGIFQQEQASGVYG